MSRYGGKNDPDRSLQMAHGAKVIRQKVVIVNNPSTINQNEELRVNFPNLGPHDVIVPRTARLAFDISLVSDDGTRTLVQNLGRAIVKKIMIKISGNQVLSIDDTDIIGCYQDLWRAKSERSALVYQGIDLSADANITKLRINASNKVATNKAEDVAISTAYGSRYYIPLDFELLESHMPYHQAGLGEFLEYALTFNDYNRVIKLKADADADDKSSAKYTISNISLEFDKITDSQLAEEIRRKYMGRMVYLYTNIMRISKRVVDKSDTIWNINLNNTAKSMKGVLLLFENQADWARDTEKFYNPKITKVEVAIDGQTSQVYAQGLSTYHHWDEINKWLGGIKRDKHTELLSKDLALADVSIGEYLTDKYALWIDLRGIDDNSLHGTGRPIANANNGITIQITKTAETAGALNMYTYILNDAQLNFEGGRFIEALS